MRSRARRSRAARAPTGRTTPEARRSSGIAAPCRSREGRRVTRALGIRRTRSIRVPSREEDTPEGLRGARIHALRVARRRPGAASGRSHRRGRFTDAGPRPPARRANAAAQESAKSRGSECSTSSATRLTARTRHASLGMHASPGWRMCRISSSCFRTSVPRSQAPLGDRASSRRAPVLAVARRQRHSSVGIERGSYRAIAPECVVVYAPAAVRPAASAFALVLFALVLASCARRYRDERAHQLCLRSCEDRNRACVLDATTSAALSACSQEVSWCVQSCPH